MCEQQVPITSKSEGLARIARELGYPVHEIQGLKGVEDLTPDDVSGLVVRPPLVSRFSDTDVPDGREWQVSVEMPDGDHEMFFFRHSDYQHYMESLIVECYIDGVTAVVDVWSVHDQQGNVMVINKAGAQLRF